MGDEELAALYPVFIDDNIRTADAHIVDVRCVDTGRSLPRGEAGRFLLRAEPLRAALDPESFFLSEVLRKATGGGQCAGEGDFGA